MNENSNEWYQAIFKRHSRRKFSDKSVEAGKLERLDELTNSLNQSAGAARIALVRSHDGSIFSGIRGGYGVIKGAPAYLAFIAQPQAAESYAQLGYIGEAAILEATSLGLGTCWVSGTFDPQAAAADLELAAEERLVAVSPLGYPQSVKSLTEKVMSGFAGSHKRKPMQQICTGEPLSKWPVWAVKAVEAARIAPSAMNRQPWIFHYNGQTLSLETAGSGGGNFSKRLDCGIALRHMEIGAQQVSNQAVSVEFLSAPQVAEICIDTD